MPIPIIVVYHSVFFLGDPPAFSPAAEAVSAEVMGAFQSSGLWDSANEFHIGVNGGKESVPYVRDLFPENAHVTYHGTASKNENSSIVLVEEIVKKLDGEAYILYCHSKGASWPVGHQLTDNWRRCFLFHLVHRWRLCLRDMGGNADCASCHYFVPPRTPPGQYIMAGNWWWAKASFLRNLSPIRERDRIKKDGIGALSSRFEAEVYLSNGPRPPKVVDYCTGWNMTPMPHR